MSQEQKTELELLKERATLLGIKFSPNIGVEKLKEKIEAAMAEQKDVDDTTDPAPEKEETPALTKGQLKAKMKAEAAKLVRVRITCMNPNKKEWSGEIISAGNSVVGQFKKYIPFDTEWHVPQIILNYLKEKKCQVFYTVKDERGNKIRRGKQVNEYAIEELPPLTEQELKELAQRQAMANGTAEG